MLPHKNLSPGEKLAMMDEFKEEVRLENKKKKKETEGRPLKNHTPIGVLGRTVKLGQMHKLQIVI